MPSPLSGEQRQACDLCHSRKVRCDRRNPCGNCQDAETPCVRQRNPKRSRREAPRRDLTRISRRSPWNRPIQPLPESQGGPSGRASVASSVVLASQPGDGQSIAPEISIPGQFLDADQLFVSRSWISLVPLTDAQITYTLFHFDRIQDLTVDRRNALESALRVASQVSESLGESSDISSPDSSVERESMGPSAELLAWMLRDIEGGAFGAFVLDYFRHISTSTLEQMGTALINQNLSPHNLILYTVCVNSVAYKFLNTVINISEDSDLTHELRKSALQYRSAAQAALRQIPLLTSPSLALLQAILCGIFLHQGSGDTTLCWQLTKAACRTCVDLRLDSAVMNGEVVSQEAYYCFMWCYMLDKNYACKTGRSRSLLEVELGTDMHQLPMPNQPMSGLLLVYVDLARIQAALIPYLDDRSLGGNHLSRSFHGIGDDLLAKMNQIRVNIDQIATPSPLWKGLDLQSEISALEFAYHSVMTAIIHLRQVNSIQTAGSTQLYLQSARQPLSALVSMCLSCDKQSAVAFLHWTLLYYPLTAYFVLFCNVVTTSNVSDFNLLKAIADCLAQSGTMSQPLAELQSLFGKFVSLARSFLNDDRLLTGESLSLDMQQPSFRTRTPSTDKAQWPYLNAGSVLEQALATTEAEMPSSMLDFSGLEQYLLPGDCSAFVVDETQLN